MTPLMKTDAAPSPILFKVKECPTYLKNSKTSDTHVIVGHKALVRVLEHKPQALSIVRHTYKLVTNEELFTAIENTMIKEMAHGTLQDVQIEDRASHHGRDAFRSYVFPSIKCDVEARKPGVAFRIVVQNSYGGGAIKVHAGAIDFFCTNGMVTGAHEASYAKHTSGVEVSRFGNLISDALHRFVTYGEKWKRWHQTQVTASAGFELLKKLAGSSERLGEQLNTQMLAEFEERGDNLWAVYSAATRWATHYPVVQREDADSVPNVLSKRSALVAEWTKLPEFA